MRWEVVRVLLTGRRRFLGLFRDLSSAVVVINVDRHGPVLDGKRSGGVRGTSVGANTVDGKRPMRSGASQTWEGRRAPWVAQLHVVRPPPNAIALRDDWSWCFYVWVGHFTNGKGTAMLQLGKEGRRCGFAIK